MSQNANQIVENERPAARSIFVGVLSTMLMGAAPASAPTPGLDKAACDALSQAQYLTAGGATGVRTLCKEEDAEKRAGNLNPDVFNSMVYEAAELGVLGDVYHFTHQPSTPEDKAIVKQLVTENPEIFSPVAKPAGASGPK